MASPSIHDLGDHFDERNRFLQVALGLVSLAQRFERLLESQAQVVRTSEVTNTPERSAKEQPPVLRLFENSDATPPLSTSLDIVLGMVAFAQQVLQLAEQLSSPPPSTMPAAPPPRSLRQWLT